MITTSFLLAASSILTLSHAAPLHRRHAVSAHSLVAREVTYKDYGGDGTVAKGWPAESKWMSFDDAWEVAKGSIKCIDDWGVDQNDDTETAAIKTGIEAAAEESKLPKEFLLAILMQESKGCVRVPTTSYGQTNPGLMQSFNGDATCNPAMSGSPPQPVKPCKDETIAKMISQGAGVGLTFGLQQAVSQSQASDVSKYYKGARIYNSGSIAPSGNLGDGIATHCYASDIANRLTGWYGPQSPCQEGTIGANQGTTGTADGNEDTTNTPTTPTPTTPAPSSASTPSPSASAAVPNIPTTPTANEEEGDAPHYPDAVKGCKDWYTVKANDTCNSAVQSAGISFDKLKELNSNLDSNCTNLWLGYAYCTSA